MFMPGDCKSWYAVSNWQWASQGWHQGIMYDMDYHAFLKEELVGFGVIGLNS